MLIKSPPSWQIPEREATPEHVFLNRRHFLGALGLGATALIGGTALAAKEEDPTADLYPAKRNETYQLDRPLTKERDAASYNNFYEFGSHKRIAREARSLKIRPWTVSFEGMLEKERQVDIDTLIRAMPLEERLYRLRCVEAWSMAVPWSGFPLAELVKYARPLSGAKYLVMQTFLDKNMASGQKQIWYPWPYTEGLTMAEATNELAFMVTGVYGKPLRKQFGAPLRLAVPWKYGFKSVKSIVRFKFTDKRPTTFWDQIQAAEYGFWANVNPEVSHPRWSQASERVLGTNKRVPTLLYNGYGEQVAAMYKDLKGEKLFM
ncbi:MAG: protein-methionine-sulfoxide reductase catalytic subunit MsrP [Alphaproteobacteria bacterium]